MKPRWQAKVSAKDEVFDVCVIGGGATGAAGEVKGRSQSGVQKIFGGISTKAARNRKAVRVSASRGTKRGVPTK